MRIRAALVETPGGPFTVRDDVDLEAPRRNEVLVRITAAGICRTDLSAREHWPFLPMVFGHEGAGVIEAVGEEVTSVVPGDTVCLTYLSCGRCGPCTSGHPAYCDVAMPGLNASGGRDDGTSPMSCGDNRIFGNFFGQSSFATHALAHETNTVTVPADLPSAVAALLGCSVQTGASTVLNVLRPEAEEALVVFGAGSVGLSALMAAVATGCGPVIAVEPIASRREMAEELGAQATLDPAMTDVAAAVRELTGGGAHHALDTTGIPGVVNQALAALRPMGNLALVVIGGQVLLESILLLSKGIKVHGVIEGDAVPAEFIPHLIELYHQGRLPIDRLITEVPFPDIETAAQAAAARRIIKPVLTFT